MEISRLISYAEKIKDEKMRERSRKFKKAQVNSGGYSNQRSRGGGSGRAQNRPKYVNQVQPALPLEDSTEIRVIIPKFKEVVKVL